ncbi:unnamed protein product [Cylindrotheca closterium]|uniref:Uncharacterized protein n=1 Tax=Cylindrotheca closterium TaxID=2856 RepID=A0AAD2CUE6_9STRA|nr:unnamed protein product [Cylindrotheca closterium]
MRDYAQYSSRIPSPRFKTGNTVNTNTQGRNGNQTLSDKRDRESTSTVASSTSSQQPAPQHASILNSTSLKAYDALSLRQHGAEATIVKLREALEENLTKDETAKASLAKSDAIILELRSTIRQLKKEKETIECNTSQQKSSNHSNAQVLELQKRVQELQNKLAVSQSSSNDGQVGELQIQLDRAHAQILTADMVRKELEDTLEAEQYTWELRVQDQERTIALMQEQIQTLTQDLEACRSQWKEAEVGWNSQLNELQQQLTQARARMATTQALKSGSQDQLMTKINQLERERAELQTCLDETLQELEAVDQEGHTKHGRAADEGEVVESLQHLLRWIAQESISETTLQNMPRTSSELLNRIRKALEAWIAKEKVSVSRRDEKAVKELKSRVNVYEQELKSREESSAELRESLKEAVTLLKPLQDAVTKGELEKRELQDKLKKAQTARPRNGGNNPVLESQLRENNFKIKELEDEVMSLQQQVEEHKQLATARESLLKAANNPVTNMPRNHNDSVSKIQRAREELRRKRETEGNLQQLLKDAQTRFHSLHEQNEQVVANNRDLQGQLKNAQDRLTSNGDLTIEEKLERSQRELSQRNAQVKQLQAALQGGGTTSPVDLSQELLATRNELAQKEHAERILNKSLKEALGLLKPLQMHLEDAEKEKMEVSKELRSLRKRFRQLQMGEIEDLSKSESINLIDGEVRVEELEEAVRQLEEENSQLHDALEDNVMGGTEDSKTRQRMVELNSRYEVTQNKLEDALVENHSLTKTLKQRELQEKQRIEEIRVLRERLHKMENELGDAQAIVDEFAVSDIGKMRRNIANQRQMV